MEDDYYDDYPLLDFMLPGDLGEGDVYAEDQIVLGPDGPEIGPMDSPWGNGEEDDDGYDDEPVSQPWNREDEEYYVVDERELSCCHEEWEDYC